MIIFIKQGFRTLIFAASIATSIGLSGCGMGELNFNLSKQQVHVFDAVKAEDRSGTELASDDDKQLVAAFPMVQSGDRYYRFDPPFSSGDISLNFVQWTPRQTVLNVSSRTGRELTLIDNSTYCASKILFIFCTETGYSKSYTSLNSGQTYDILGSELTSRKESISSGNLVFMSVPLTALSGFRLSGPGWNSENIAVGLSDEEIKAAQEVRDLMTQNKQKFTFRSLAMLLNRQNQNPLVVQLVSDELMGRLGKSTLPESYDVVINEIDGNVVGNIPKIKEVALGYLDTIYRTQIRPLNDAEKIATFLETDGKSLPVKRFMEAVNDGVLIESTKIGGVLDQIDRVQVWEKLWIRVSQGETVEDIKEKFLRTAYQSIVAEKRNERNLHAIMMYRALLENKAASTSHTAFELQRDQEFREFFTTQFAMLAKNQLSATSEIVAQVKSMSVKLNESLAEVAQNTKFSPESRSEEQARNWRMAVDMHYATKPLN